MNIYTGLKDITEAFKNNSPPCRSKIRTGKGRI